MVLDCQPLEGAAYYDETVRQVSVLIEKAKHSKDNMDFVFNSIATLRSDFDLMDLTQCVSDCAILVAS